MHTIPGNIIPGGNGRFGNRNIPPQNVSPPVISGTAVVGQTLTAVAGTWTGIPTPTVIGNWQRNGVNISGATGLTYVLTQADAGNTANITYEETATNTAGTVTQDSNVIAQVLDSDANALLSAIISDGVTPTSTERSATNDLYIDLKSSSIYNKLPIFYPMLGNSLTSMKYNGKDPRNLNSAFRLSQTGTVTYSSLGATGNGSNGQLGTFYVVQSANKDSIGAGVYVQSTGYNGNCAFGNTDGALGVLALFPSAGGSMFAYLNDRNNINRTNASTNKGLFAAYRESSTSVRLRRNGADLGTNPITSNSSATISLTSVLMFNGGFSNQYFNGTINFAYVSIGFTTSDDVAMNNAIVKYNTALSRL